MHVHKNHSDKITNCNIGFRRSIHMRSYYLVKTLKQYKLIFYTYSMIELNFKAYPLFIFFFQVFKLSYVNLTVSEIFGCISLFLRSESLLFPHKNVNWHACKHISCKYCIIKVIVSCDN